MRRSFEERNPVVIAVVGLLVVAAGVFVAFRSQDLPVIGAGPTYHADFSESAGLASGDDVLVAGVKVGDVSGVHLEGSHVRVDFRVSHAWLGDQSSAAIGIKTLLGQKFLAITPTGTAVLHHGATIPQSRTTAPFDVEAALEGLGSNLGEVDTTQLAKSFDALSTAFSQQPATIRSALDGLSALSRTIASRDVQLAQLLASSRAVTTELAGSSDQVQSLISDGDLLVTALDQRSAAITALLQGTQQLSTQLIGLVKDDEATLHPALVQLGTVTTELQKDQADLQRGLSLIGPYYALLSSTLSNGRWLDAYVCGLFDADGNPQLDSTAVRDCAPRGVTGGA